MKVSITALVLISCSASLSVAVALRPISASQNAKTNQSQVRKAPATAKITAEAKWSPTSSFMAVAGAACDPEPPERIASCYIKQMATIWAPAAAVQFSRRMYTQNGGEFCVLLDFEKLGPVDMAKVFYPLRAELGNALYLVNGDPAILDVDDLTKLDIRGMERDNRYQAMKHHIPALKLWAAPRWGTAWDLVQKHANGGQSFDIYYMLDVHPPSGRWISGAHFDWNFDARGKFLETKFTGGVGPLPD